MKTILSLAISIVLVTLSFNLYAQTGGLNVGSISAVSEVTVGSTSSETVIMTNQLVSLPPLTISQIEDISQPQKGMVVYSSDSDVLLCYDGSWWRRIDGRNDQFLAGPPPCEGTDFYDQDGNLFYGVEIGNQCWMDRNLAVTHFPNGDPIRYIGTSSDATWGSLSDTETDDAFCYYNSDSDPGFGALYTYAAAIAKNWTKDNDDVTNGEGGQGICPDGWHLPTDNEWTTLSDYLGGGGVAGGKLKETGTLNWSSPNNGATNETGFTALPGGTRDYANGSFNFAYDYGYYISATPQNEFLFNSVYYRLMESSNDNLSSYTTNKSRGFSVRCIRD